MICRCGYQNEPDDFYCAQCGKKLSPKKGKGKGWIIAVVIALIVAAGAVAAWFIFNNDEPVPDEPETSETSEPADPTETETTGGTEEELLTGWDEEGLRYYQEGELLTGQQTIDGEYYYFSEEGEKQTGWQNIGDSWYYYTAEGPAPGEGWYEDDKGWFYLEKDGKLYSENELKMPGVTYELDAEGYLLRTVYATVSCTPEKDTVDGQEQDVLKLPGHVTGCTKLSFTLGGGFKSMSDTKWVVWIRYEGVWTKLEQKVDFNVGEGEVCMLTFTNPANMDAILISGPDAKVELVFTNLFCTK